ERVATAAWREAREFERAAAEDTSVLDRTSGNFALIETLRRWGVTFFAGVNGGGLIHVAKYLQPYSSLAQSHDGHARMLTMGEYVAGFAPLGYWFASGRVGGCIATTGAATKLAASGITDAKLHNVPAVYVFALNSTLSIGMGPLQDVSEYGANIVPQLRAALGDGCVVIDSTSTFEDRMRQAQRVLAESKPVAICFYPDILSRTVEVDVPRQERRRVVDPREVDRFLSEFRKAAD